MDANSVGKIIINQAQNKGFGMECTRLSTKMPELNKDTLTVSAQELQGYP